MIAIQQAAPNKSGFPPVLISFMMSLFKPTAAIASTIKNLLRVFSGVKNPASTPNFSATVVINEAAIKYNMKNGKIFLILTELPSPPLFFAARVRINARTNVIGIIARVLVNFTVTALSSVWLPKIPHAVPRGSGCGNGRRVVYGGACKNPERFSACRVKSDELSENRKNECSKHIKKEDDRNRLCHFFISCVYYRCGCSDG